MRIALALALALTTTACPFGDDDSGSGSRYVAVEDIPAAYREANCTRLVRCGLFPDHAECVSANIGVGFYVGPEVVAAMKAGNIIYNGNAVAACLDSVAARECDRTSQTYRTVSPSCSNYFRGTQPSGAACFLDQECISQQCAGEEYGTTCVAGTCVGDTPPSTDLLPIGSPCASFTACMPGAYCSTDTGMCTKLIDEGGACTDSEECNYGFACAGVTGARTCRAVPTEGQPCPNSACRDEGLYCSGTTGVCTRYGVPPAACSVTAQCSPYYRCDTSTGQCVRGPGLGQQCSTDCFTVGTFCDPATVRCVELRDNGAACTSSMECKSVNCDFDTGVCAEWPICS